MFTKEKNKELVERYPFLLPRNVWTDKLDEDYDYSYILGIDEIPEGWNDLFLQMCEDIRQPLIDANYLDKFRFSQIKEKYGTLRLYHFGAPKEVDKILADYEYISQFVCENCGKPAEYVTTGWIESLCKNCVDENKHLVEHCEPIKLNLIRRVTRFSDTGKKEEQYDCSYIWNRLYEVSND